MLRSLVGSEMCIRDRGKVADTLTTKETLKRIYNNSITNNQYSLRAGLLLVMHLAKKIKLMDLCSLLNEKLPCVVELLNKDVHGMHPSSNGGQELYAGIDKYRILEFLELMMNFKIPFIYEKLKELKVKEHFINLLLLYSNNTTRNKSQTDYY